MTMRERIARALHESMSEQDVMGYLDAKIDASVLADAVLAAIREPTEGMRGAGLKQMSGSCLSVCDGLYAADEDDASDVFKAMIDAAISEGKT